MLNDIITWNLKRNELKFDPALEAKMLSEEANEFYTATTLVERVREYCDFCFVLQGTKAKFYSRKYTDHREAVYAYEHFKEFMEWAEEVQDKMYESLCECVAWRGVDDIVSQSFDAVIAANNAKGTEKNSDGKVIKGPDYVSPSDAIAEILRRYNVEACS